MIFETTFDVIPIEILKSERTIKRRRQAEYVRQNLLYKMTSYPIYKDTKGSPIIRTLFRRCSRPLKTIIFGIFCSF